MTDTIRYDKITLVDSTSQVIEIYHNQVGVALVNESAGIFVTVIAGVKVDQVSLAAALTALGA